MKSLFIFLWRIDLKLMFKLDDAMAYAYDNWGWRKRAVSKWSAVAICALWAASDMIRNPGHLPFGEMWFSLAYAAMEWVRGLSYQRDPIRAERARVSPYTPWIHYITHAFTLLGFALGVTYALIGFALGVTYALNAALPYAVGEVAWWVWMIGDDVLEPNRPRRRKPKEATETKLLWTPQMEGAA